VAENDLLTFCGEQFRPVEQFGQMALLEFAKQAQNDVDSNDMAGLAAMYDLLEASIHPDDWARFKKVAKQKAASGAALLDVVGQVISREADRPTSRPSDSSDGPSTTEPSSSSTPADRAIAREAGRPDVQRWLQVAQERTAEAQTA
jgi:hypothetical protein